MKNTLTKKEEALMDVVADEWINNALHKGGIDKEEAETGIKWLYYIADLKEPKVTFVRGIDDFSDKVRVKVWAKVRVKVWDKVWVKVWDKVRVKVGVKVGAKVRDKVRDKVRVKVRDKVRVKVWAKVRVKVRDKVGDSFSYCAQSYDSDWGSWAEYYQRIGILDGKEDGLKEYLGYLKSGAFFVSFWEDEAIVMERPSECHFDEQGRLHSTTGPALAFPDGSAVYSINGVEFPKEWWEKIVKNELSAEEVFAIDNAEHRRIAYEMMDKTKLKELKDHKVLDEVRDDGYGNKMRVVSFTVQNMDKPIKFLNCFCPSTKREYYLGTDKEKCLDAKSASFGLDNILFTKEW